MNKIRIIGLILLLSGIGMIFLNENDTMDFVYGLLFGAGVALIMSGRLPWKKKDSDNKTV